MIELNRHLPKQARINRRSIRHDSVLNVKKKINVRVVVGGETKINRTKKIRRKWKDYSTNSSIKSRDDVASVASPGSESRTAQKKRKRKQSGNFAYERGRAAPSLALFLPFPSCYMMWLFPFMLYDVALG